MRLNRREEKHSWIQKHSKILFILGLSLIFLVRIYNIDCDLPAWGIINYQPMDEGQYATMAINKYEYGSIRPDIKEMPVDFLTCAHIRTNFFGNLLIYIGMVLFGDNYLGFRISSVFVGFLSCALFVLILSKLNKKYSINKKGLLPMFAILFCTDFAYLVASRVVETTIYRTFFLLLIILVMLIEHGETYRTITRYFMAGFLAVTSVFAVYITNIYIVVALFLAVLVINRKNRKEVMQGLMGFIAGCGCAFVVCEVYYYFVWGSSCLANTMQIIADFSGISGYEGGTNNQITYILISFLTTNTNMYNLAVVFMLLLALPCLFKHRDEFITLNFLLIICLLGQTFITEDYIVRKGSMLYPIFLFLLFTAQTYDSTTQQKCKKGKRINDIVYSIACMLVCIYIPLYRIIFIENDTKLDFNLADKWFIYIQIIALLIILICKIHTFYSQVSEKRNILMFALIATVMVNLYFDIRYVYANSSYTEKELMIDIGKEVEDQFVFGIYSISFTLYNNIKPVVNNNNSLAWQMYEHRGDGSLYLDYCDYNFDRDQLQAYGIEIKEMETYPRNFSTFSIKRNVSLYTFE